MSPIPKEWINLLERIQVVFPRAFIAGGALRDHTLGKTPKDIDVFIPVNSKVGWDELCPIELGTGLLNSMYGCVVTQDDTSRYMEPEESERGILDVYKTTMDSLDVDLVFIPFRDEDGHDQMVRTIREFDISLCQIGFHRHVVCYTPEFMDSVKRKAFYLCNINRTDRNMKRIERMKEKFPDFTLEDTDGPF